MEDKYYLESEKCKFGNRGNFGEGVIISIVKSHGNEVIRVDSGDKFKIFANMKSFIDYIFNERI